jgi:hypothetical protein
MDTTKPGRPPPFIVFLESRHCVDESRKNTSLRPKKEKPGYCPPIEKQRPGFQISKPIYQVLRYSNSIVSQDTMADNARTLIPKVGKMEQTVD